MKIQNDALKQLEDLKVRHREVGEHIQDLIQILIMINYKFDKKITKGSIEK